MKRGVSPSEALGIEGLGLFRTNDPETSRLAAVAVQPHAETGRQLVLKLLQEHGPLTDFELAHLSGWRQVSIGKRRGELRDAGLVEKSDLVRDNEFGNPCVVWKLV